MACYDYYSMPGHSEVQKKINKIEKYTTRWIKFFPCFGITSLSEKLAHFYESTFRALDLQSKENLVFSMNSVVGLLISFMKSALSKSV